MAVRTRKRITPTRVRNETNKAAALLIGILICKSPIITSTLNSCYLRLKIFSFVFHYSSKIFTHYL
jgi:hypothetical protein